MNTRYLPLVVCLTVPAWLAACEKPAPETPPQPAATTSAEAAPAPPPAAADMPPAAPPVVEAPAPPPKPGKERIVGKWQFSFEGDPKAHAEDEAKKKFPKDKDQAKRDAHVAKIAESAAGEWVEFVDGYYVSHVTLKGKDKVILRVKYDVPMDSSGKISMKPVGKDEISKKELKMDPASIAFTDDNTISMFDPQKKITLIFKRK